ncbi:tetratricopeptide repeat protein [Spongiibacter sp.]|uniref:tetratricopeptide repeat protein n=1 Tax=Spongiibacter sp. TaxID=2024860 RepID=UPI00356146BA
MPHYTAHRATHWLATLALVLLTGCANIQNKGDTVAGNCNRTLNQTETVKLDLVSQLIDEANYYSALAHLENDSSGSPRALWLRAEAQRKTGLLNEAYNNYRDLSLSCMTAAGHAGMAKILATRGDLAIAHQHMLKARQLAPTNADIRNDYGFILLAMGDFKAAQREFMTAMQLHQGHPVALRNMVISLILDGDSRTAMRLAKNNNIDDNQFRELVNKASHFAKPAVAQRDISQ